MKQRDPLYERLLLLDRLEDLLEEMEELAVSSISELRSRIEALELEIADVGDSENER